MGTRSVVATGTVEDWKGRYVHWDGYPTGVGQALRSILIRDGFEVATQTILRDHYGWSSLDAQYGEELPEFLSDGRFVRVEGYGTAYTTEQGQSSEDDWHTSKNSDPLWIEWAYIVQPEKIIVLKGDYKNGCFREVGTVLYDDDDLGMCVIEDAVYAADEAEYAAEKAALAK